MEIRKSFGKMGLVIIAFSLIVSLTGAGLAADKKEIRIGAPIPVTGILSMLGAEQKWAYEKAVADINKEGGIFVKEYGKKLPVKLIIADAESDPGKAVAAVERLVKIEKVDLLLSSQTSPLIVPTSVAAEKFKKYYHASTCLIPLWKENNFKWSTLYFFEMTQAASVPFEILNSIPESERPKKLALLNEDSLDGRGFAPFFRDAAKKYGYSFVVDESWAIGAKDYSSQILKMKGKGIDGLIIFGANTDCVTFVRQLKEVGLSMKYIHGYKGTWGTEFWNALGKDAQYVVADGFWSDDLPYPKCKEIGQGYYKKFGKQSVSIGMFYALSQTLFAAIEKAGTLDSLKVKEAVLSMDFKDTVMGDVKYRADGTALLQLGAFQWWDGKLQLVYPFVEGGWKVKVAPPWKKR